MVAGGYAEPHHGHDPAAVKAAAGLEAENQGRVDAIAASDVVAAETAATVLADKQVEKDARHQLELAARRPGKRR